MPLKAKPSKPLRGYVEQNWDTSIGTDRPGLDEDIVQAYFDDGNESYEIVEVPDAKWTTLYRAWFETRNFTFEAYGTSERHVRELLAAAWAKHAKQSGADPESPACASAVETLWGRYRLAQRKTISRAGWPSACPGAMSAVRRDRQQDTGTLRPRA